MKKENYLIIGIIGLLLIAAIAYVIHTQNENNDLNESLQKESAEYGKTIRKTVKEATGENDSLQNLYPNIKTVTVE